MLNDHRRGLLMAFGTALLWGAMAPTVKIIAASGLSQITVVAYRAIFTVIFLGAYILFKSGRERFVVSRNMFQMYFMLGFLTVVLNSTGFMMATSYLSIPKSLILHYTFPLVTMAGSVLITKEKPTGMQVLAGVLVLVGLYVGFGPGSLEAGPISVLGILWGIASVIGISGQTLLSRSMGRQKSADPLLQLFYCNLFGGAVMIILNSIFRGWPDLGLIDLKLFLIMQYPAAFAGLLGFGLLFTSLKYISASTVSLICTLEIVFAMLLAPLMIDQPPTLFEVAGALIVLAAVSASIISAKKT